MFDSLSELLGGGPGMADPLYNERKRREQEEADRQEAAMRAMRERIGSMGAPGEPAPSLSGAVGGDDAFTRLRSTFAGSLGGGDDPMAAARPYLRGQGGRVGGSEYGLGDLLGDLNDSIPTLSEQRGSPTSNWQEDRWGLGGQAAREAGLQARFGDDFLDLPIGQQQQQEARANRPTTALSIEGSYDMAAPTMLANAPTGMMQGMTQSPTGGPPQGMMRGMTQNPGPAMLPGTAGYPTSPAGLGARLAGW